jgi:hypothetical protein
MLTQNVTRRVVSLVLRNLSLAVAAIALVLPGRESAAIMVPVRADLLGPGGEQTIGTIVADGGFKGLGTVGAGLRADFTFAKNFGYLDDRYDFDWVNVLTKQEFKSVADGGNNASALFPNPPNIDLIPQKDDSLPFYYNDNEWRTKNTFGGVQIHADGEYSRFLDVPSQPADRKFDFSTFLVLRDHGAYTLDGKTTFCVLAGFSWQYQGAAQNPGDNRGTSTAIGSVTINQDAIDTLMKALNSEGAQINDAETMFKADPFTGWSAMRGCTLVPEPAAMSLLLVGLGMLWLWRRSGGRRLNASS